MLRVWAAAASILVLGCGTASRSSPGPAEGTAGAIGSQVMVTLKPAPPPLWSQIASELEQSHRLRTVYSWTMASLGEQCIVFEVSPGRSAATVARRLASDPRVSSAQLLQQFDVLADAAGASAYNDPYARLQYGAQALRLEKAHRWATGKGVRVAVIDTGVDLDHPDLQGRIVKASNFVDRGERTFTSDFHGTAVAGVIAAAANNQVGIVGVAPGAELFALKACWQQPPGTREAVCNSYTLAKALDFAIMERAQVINFSLAGPRDPLLARLIGAALARGIAVIAADGDASRPFPAGVEGVLGIAGAGGPDGNAGAVARSTLAAPAVDILTTVPRGSYDFFSGSSFAAAQVSGVAALLLEREPELTPAQIAALIRKTARPLAGANGGAGALSQVDACAALASALGEGSCA